MEVDKIVEDLLENNNPPSDATMEEVKRRLDGPVRSIDDIDAEIHDLEQRLNGLRAIRAEREALIERYQTVLAPIRRLPLDVLGEIFHRCLSTHRNPIMKASECPLLLTRVCSTWRATAISNPRLWARLHVTFSESEDEDADEYTDIPPILYNDNWQPQPQRQVPRSLRLKCDAVKEWLSRSGDLPLSVSVLYTTDFNRGLLVSSGAQSGTVPACGTTRNFLKVLAALSPRFEDLELQMPTEVYRELEGMMDVSEMKKLTSIRARYHSLPEVSTAWHPTAKDTDPMLLLEAPNLCKVSICTYNYRPWGALDSTNSYVRWNRLTNISVHSPLSYDEITFLLGHSRNLVHFKAIMAQLTVTVGSIHVAPILYDGHITLSSLLTLSLTELSQCDPRSTERLYDRIDAPLLKQVTYSNSFYPGTIENTPSAPILNLLRRSTRLKKLAFNGPSAVLAYISSVLREVPSVTHLLLGPDMRSQDGSLERFQSVTRSLSVRMRSVGHRTGVPPLDLEGLISVKPDNINVEYDLPILPNLESFEVSSSNVRLNNQDLIKFITSRMRAPSSPLFSRVANLKWVAIVFYQTKQHDLDIVSEVQRHAELAGVDMIDLSLDYPKVPERAINPSAPDYGLVSNMGRSWYPRDAGDDDGWV